MKIVTSLPFSVQDQDELDSVFDQLGLDDDIAPYTYNYEIPVV